MNHDQLNPKTSQKPIVTKLTLVILLLAVLLINLTVFAVYLRPAQAATALNPNEQVIVSLTNSERVKLGLNGLKVNSLLSKAAYTKATDMLRSGYFEHVTPDGKAPWAFIEATGYDYRRAGENLAIGFSNAAAAIPAWMASPTHRANMVKTNYTETGIAAVTGQFQGRETTIIVQLFAAPEFGL